jgi:hypothetical protein
MAIYKPQNNLNYSGVRLICKTTPPAPPLPSARASEDARKQQTRNMYTTLLRAPPTLSRPLPTPPEAYQDTQKM